MSFLFTVNAFYSFDNMRESREVGWGGGDSRSGCPPQFFRVYGFSNGKTFTDPAWSEAGPSLDLRILIVSKKNIEQISIACNLDWQIYTNDIFIALSVRVVNWQ